MIIADYTTAERRHKHLRLAIYSPEFCVDKDACSCRDFLEEIADIKGFIVIVYELI